MKNLNKIWNPVTKRFVKLNGQTGKKVLKGYLQYLNNISKMYGGSNEKGGELHIFKAKWCGYCKESEPLFNTLKKKSKNKKYNVVIHEYTDDNEKDAFEKFGVSSFPTLIFNKNNKQTKYDTDQRTEGKIAEWIEQLG